MLGRVVSTRSPFFFVARMCTTLGTSQSYSVGSQQGMFSLPRLVRKSPVLTNPSSKRAARHHWVCSTPSHTPAAVTRISGEQKNTSSSATTKPRAPDHNPKSFTFIFISLWCFRHTYLKPFL